MFCLPHSVFSSGAVGAATSSLGEYLVDENGRCFVTDGGAALVTEKRVAVLSDEYNRQFVDDSGNCLIGIF